MTNQINVKSCVREIRNEGLTSKKQRVNIYK